MGVILAAAALGGLTCCLRSATHGDDRSRGYSVLVDRIDTLLPQTQCGACGYTGCRPYAEAVAKGAADINRCPPGGARTIALLADLLGRTLKPLDPALPALATAVVAHIDEAECIGCLKCVQACPVDAILGAAGQMHTVIPQFCTGCELCVAPCPVDCIDMQPQANSPQRAGWPKPVPLIRRAA